MLINAFSILGDTEPLGSLHETVTDVYGVRRQRGDTIAKFNTKTKQLEYYPFFSGKTDTNSKEFKAITGKFYVFAKLDSSQKTFDSQQEYVLATTSKGSMYQNNNFCYFEMQEEWDLYTKGCKLIKSGSKTYAVNTVKTPDIVIAYDPPSPEAYSKFINEVASNYNHADRVSDFTKSFEAALFVTEEDAVLFGYYPSKFFNFFVDEKCAKIEKSLNKTLFNETYTHNMSTTHNADEHNDLVPKITEGFTKYKSKLESRVAKKHGRIIDYLFRGKTFGVEFETAYGNVQTSCLKPLGLIPLIDGSLRVRSQPELVTPVLGKDPKDLVLLAAACYRMSFSAAVDKTCAMHVHIGNLKKTPLTISALYVLFCKLQDELFNFVPPYKTDEVALMKKQKNYSAKLRNLMDKPIVSGNTKDLNLLYREIFYFFTGVMPSSVEHTEALSSEWVSGKRRVLWSKQWLCFSRYHALNMVNVFTAKSGTVEFRLHGPTLHPVKTLFWLIICNAIVAYSETNPWVCLSDRQITLDEVLDGFFRNGSEETDQVIKDLIKNYIASRKAYYKKLYLDIYSEGIKNGDLPYMACKLHEEDFKDEMNINSSLEQSTFLKELFAEAKKLSNIPNV